MNHELAPQKQTTEECSSANYSNVMDVTLFVAADHPTDKTHDLTIHASFLMFERLWYDISLKDMMFDLNLQENSEQVHLPATKPV